MNVECAKKVISGVKITQFEKAGTEPAEEYRSVRCVCVCVCVCERERERERERKVKYIQVDF